MLQKDDIKKNEIICEHHGKQVMSSFDFEGERFTGECPYCRGEVKLALALCVAVLVFAFVSQVSLIPVNGPTNHVFHRPASMYSCITHKRSVIINSKEIA